MYSMCYGEKFAAWTHSVGTVVAIPIVAVLFVLATTGGDPWKIVSVSIYGATLILLYSFSTLYHSVLVEDNKCAPSTKPEN